jgi:anti-anti-sigma regulatory factor
MRLQPFPLLLSAPDGGAVVRLPGPALRGEDLRPARLVAKEGRHALHLDLGNVVLPTAAGLGRLVALHRELRATGGQLVLCNVHDRVFEVLVLTRLTELLDVRPDPA